MNFFTTINLLLELGVCYLKLKIKTATFDILDKFDARIDKMDKERESLRKSPHSGDQDRATRLLDEIMEEKKKFAIWKNELEPQEKPAIVKP